VLSLPLQKLPFGTPVRNDLLDTNLGWRKRHLKGLQFNYSTSPYYEYYIDDVSELLLGNHTALSELKIASMTWSHRALGITSILQTDSGSFAGKVMDYAPESYHHPEYRQNFSGFYTGMSNLDLLFNHGPDSLNILLNGNHS